MGHLGGNHIHDNQSGARRIDALESMTFAASLLMARILAGIDTPGTHFHFGIGRHFHCR